MMADDSDSDRDEHIRLSGVIKNVHARLRKKFKETGDFEKVWESHCQDESLLLEYADAMHHLAVDHWARHPETRIDWCRQTCSEYFLSGGLKKVLEKELRKQEFLERQSESQAAAAAGDVRSDDDSYSADVSVVTSQCCGVAGDGGHSRKISVPFIVDNCVNSGASSDDIQLGTSPVRNAISHMTLESRLTAVRAHSPVGGDRSCAICGTNLPYHEVSANKCREFVEGQTFDEDQPESPPDICIGEGDMDKEAVYSKYGPTKYNTISLPFHGKMRLLDVGSCFNPFLKFDEFLSLGIDISPAVDSVYRCDFLHLETMEPLQLAEDTMESFIQRLPNPVERLPRESFHVVVFSLLLEYFPSSYQRWLCVQMAHQLLMHNALLLIITPDSHHVNKNAPQMASWRCAIEGLGFSRWRYIKQEHLHCMAFRKVALEQSDLVSEVSPDMLYIPQDYNNADTVSFLESLPHTEEDDEFLRDNFLQLPALSDITTDSD